MGSDIPGTRPCAGTPSPSPELVQRVNRRVSRGRRSAPRPDPLRARKDPVPDFLVLLDEVVVGVEEVQLAAPDHPGMLEAGAGDLQLKGHPASLEDVAQDRIPELCGQGRTAVDDDPEPQWLALRLGRTRDPGSQKQQDHERYDAERCPHEASSCLVSSLTHHLLIGPVLGSSSDVARELPGRPEELPVASGRRVCGGGALQPRDRSRRVLLPARAQRVRQDDGAQDARGIRGPDRGTDRDGRAARDRREPRPRGGLPGRRLAVRLAHRRRERRVWAADGWCPEGGAAGARHGLPGARGSEGPAAEVSGGALRVA